MTINCQGLSNERIDDRQRGIAKTPDSAAAMISSPLQGKGPATRAGLAPDLAAMEWSAFRKLHVHFVEAGKQEQPPLTGLEQYSVLRDQYLASGYGPNPLETLEKRLVPVELWGHRAIVDSEMKLRLLNAHDVFAKIPGSGDPIKKTFGGFSPRAQRGSSKISNHALGRAVDIDAERNAIIFRPEIIYVINAATQVQINKQLRMEELFEISQRFRNFATKEWLDAQDGKLGSVIAKNRKELDKLAADGFIDLDRRFIEVMTDPQGGNLGWGGYYSSRKDAMHFEMKTEGPGSRS